MTPVETMLGVALFVETTARAHHRYRSEHGRASVDDTGGRLAQSNPVLRQLGLRSLGRPARGHLLLSQTLLIVGQEGGTHREGGGPEKVPNRDQ